MEWYLLVAGLLIGFVSTGSWVAGIVFGLVGLTMALTLQRQRLTRRLDQLAAELEHLRQPGTQVGQAAERQPEGEVSVPWPVPGVTPAHAYHFSQTEQLIDPLVEAPEEEFLDIDYQAVDEQLAQFESPVSPPVEQPRKKVPVTPRRPRQARPSPREPGLLQRGINAARDWLMGGNPVLRVGVVLLFLGLAFLLRYAAERVTVPIELRYIGVASVAILLLAIGWRLRHAKTAYGLTLQGAGVAILYLTVFAALYLHPLISPGMAFVLLLLVVIFSTTLAVAQNALVLAAVATLGGFATPLLTAIDDHLSLFSYYLLLNLGIFAIAWLKAWRPLNLIGFVGTFSIGLWWGMRFYHQELWVSTEVFLSLFFLLYVAIGLLFARRRLMASADAPPQSDLYSLLRWAVGRSDYIDASLLFGPPLVGFGLQYAVVSPFEFGPAYSALALGLFYLSLATLLWRRLGEQQHLLVEIYLALGVIFGSLAIPLALDAEWTSAVWAVEGAGIYWVGLHQRRKLARLFALLLQIGAAIGFLSTLLPGDQTLLDGPPLSALLLGLSLLFIETQLRKSGTQAASAREQELPPLLATAGWFFLYLIPPLLLAGEATAASWAVAGLLTLYLGLRVGALSYLACALTVQLLAGALFVLQLQPADPLAGGGVFDMGLRGLFIALLIGLCLIGGMLLAMNHSLVRDNPILLRGSSLLSLIGLSFLNLSVLFILPWETVSAIWAASGLLIVWLSLRLQLRGAFFFGLTIQLLGGVAFLQQGSQWAGGLLGAETSPFSGTPFWTPVALALAAFAGAWLLHRQRLQPQTLTLSQAPLEMLSHVVLLWGASWWGLAAYLQIEGFVHPSLRGSAMLLAATASVALWSLPVKRLQWPALGVLALGIVPAGILILLASWQPEYHPAANLGAIAWPAMALTHFWILRRLDGELPAWPRSLAHLIGIWLLLSVLALEMRYLFMSLSEHYNAWRWLGWALVPSSYLLLISFLPRLPWPMSVYGREYRLQAALPLAGLMLLWVWLAATQSNGAAQPLPFLPLANPLTLSLLLVLFAVFHWWRAVWLELDVNPVLAVYLPWLVGGVLLFLVLTTEVFRTAYHWAGIPFQLGPMLHSMLVQAALSLLWTSMALGLMIAGHRRQVRTIWIVGGLLIAAVVVKLFLVELGNHGGLERIFSFIGVGALLLVIGYFSPLPPRKQSASEQEEGS